MSLLAEEEWREAPGWSGRPKRVPGLLLRLRPIGFALRAVLCEEGNVPCSTIHPLISFQIILQYLGDFTRRRARVIEFVRLEGNGGHNRVAAAPVLLA